MLHFRNLLLLLPFIAAWLLSPPQIFALTTDSPALISPYRGQSNRVLAVTSNGKITERDLFLYLLMSRSDTPLLFEQFCQTSQTAQRDALRTRLVDALRNYVFTQQLAQEASHSILYQPIDELERYLQDSIARLKALSQIPTRNLSTLRLRILLQPVQEVVWIDRTIAPQVNVTREDISKYLKEHPNLACTPKRAQVRCIFLRFSKNISPSEIDLRAGKIRQDIVDGRITFADAARKFSDSPEAQQGGLTPEFEEGTYPSAVEEQAFSLKFGEISPLITDSEGIYLLQGVTLVPSCPITPGEVDPKITTSLFFKQLQLNYALEMTKLREKNPVANKAYQFDTLEPNDKVLDMRRFYLTADECLELFEGLADDDFEIRKDKMSAVLDRTANLEMIAAYNESHNHASDPLLLEGSRIAINLMRASQRLQEIMRQQPALTPQQILDNQREHPKAYKAITDPQISMIQLRVLKPEELGEARAQAEMQRMLDVLTKARDAVTSSSLDELASKWPVPDAHPADIIPETIEKALVEQANESIEVIRWNSRMGDATLDPETKALVADAWQKVKETNAAGRRFLPVAQGKNVATLFYLEQPLIDAPGAQKLLHHALYEIAAKQTQIQTVEEFRKERLKQAEFELTLP